MRNTIKRYQGQSSPCSRQRVRSMPFDQQRQAPSDTRLQYGVRAEEKKQSSKSSVAMVSSTNQQLLIQSSPTVELDAVVMEEQVELMGISSLPTLIPCMLTDHRYLINTFMPTVIRFSTIQIFKMVLECFMKGINKIIKNKTKVVSLTMNQDSY